MRGGGEGRRRGAAARGGGESEGGGEGEGGGNGWLPWARLSCRCFHSVISFLSGKEMP